MMETRTLTHSGPNELTAQAADLLGLSPQDFQALARTVFIAVLHRQSEGIAAPMMTASLAWGYWQVKGAPVQDNFGGNMDITRHGMVDVFLKYAAGDPNLQHLVMIDNDEDVPWDAPFRLALWNKDVVTGVVCSIDERRGGVYANFTVRDAEGVARYPSTQFTRLLPGSGLVEVQDVGAGLLCLSRSLLERMRDEGIQPFRIPEKIRDHCFETGRLTQSEDTAFARQCEALGVPRYVDFSVRARHLKSVWVEWPKHMIDPDLPGRTWKVDAREYHHG